MRVSYRADSLAPRSSLAAHPSDVGAGEEGKEDIVKASVDEHLHGKKFLMFRCHPRKCEPRKNWLLIFQAEKVTKMLRAFLQRHEEKFMKSLKCYKY